MKRLNVHFKRIIQFQKFFQSTFNPETSTKPFSSIPEPKKLPLLGTMIDYTKYRNFDISRLYEFVKKRHQELGPIYKETILPGLTNTIVFVSSPNDVETMFRNDARLPFRPSQEVIAKGREPLRIKSSLFTSQGEEWYKLRRLYNEHLLTNQSIWSYVDQQLEVANQLADYINKNKNEAHEVLDFDYVLYKWALENTSIFTLDSKLGALSGTISKEAKEIIDSSDDLFESWAKLLFATPLWKYYDTADVKKVYLHQKRQYEAIKQFRMLQPNHGSGRFETIVKNSNLNDKMKESVFLDVFAAGVDTTSNAASFVLYCLATNLDKQQILREEVNQVLHSDKEISGKTLHQMKYMYAVLRETQRLFPLAQGTLRKIHKDMVLSGYCVPAGSLVTTTANIINNRDSKYFENPDSFIPERWLTAQSKMNRFAMSGSFGVGARRCPGRRFALQEVMCLCIALLNRYQIEYHHEPFEAAFRFITKPSRKSRFSFVPLE